MIPVLNISILLIVWNKKKYIGTSLKQDDKRLGEYVRFLKKNNVAIVKLDSAQRTKKGAIIISKKFREIENVFFFAKMISNSTICICSFRRGRLSFTNCHFLVRT